MPHRLLSGRPDTEWPVAIFLPLFWSPGVRCCLTAPWRLWAGIMRRTEHIALGNLCVPYNFRRSFTGCVWVCVLGFGSSITWSIRTVGYSFQLFVRNGVGVKRFEMPLFFFEKVDIFIVLPRQMDSLLEWYEFIFYFCFVLLQIWVDCRNHHPQYLHMVRSLFIRIIAYNLI